MSTEILTSNLSTEFQFKVIPYVLSLIIFISCEDNKEVSHIPDKIPLQLYMDSRQKDDLYIFNYPNGEPHTYTPIYYQTLPMTRVFWFSPDSFDVLHMNQWFRYPIIQYSTYSNGNDGSGQQMIYISESHIGDTLNIIGCVSDDCDSLQFLVDLIEIQ
jgi:hypothetical protein